MASLAIVAGALLASTTPAPPSILATGKWSIDYAPDHCTLLRQFGSGVDQRTLAIQPTAGLLTVEISIRAPVGSNVPRKAFRGSLVLAPSSEKFEVTAKLATIAEGGWSYRLSADRAILDKLASASRLDINVAQEFRVVLGLNGAAEAVTALRTCERDLLVSWGVDPDRFRPLIRPGQPGFVDLSQYFGADNYPYEAVASHAEGKVVTLLRVGPDGKVTGCRAIASSGNLALDTQTCATSGRFRYPTMPGADGQPVAFWTVFSINWKLPD